MQITRSSPTAIEKHRVLVTTLLAMRKAIDKVLEYLGYEEGQEEEIEEQNKEGSL